MAFYSQDAGGALISTCSYLVLATSFAKPYIPEGVEGIEHAEGYETISGDAARPPAPRTEQKKGSLESIRNRADLVGSMQETM